MKATEVEEGGVRHDLQDEAGQESPGQTAPRIRMNCINSQTTAAYTTPASHGLATAADRVAAT